MENISNSSAGAVLLTASNSTEACPGCRQCATESDWCSEILPCCDANARCEPLVGGLGAKCVKQCQGCVAEEAVCGGHGMLTQQCCGDLQCQWRGDKMRCVSMDTPNWHNGYHYCSSEVPKESGTKYCSSEGWTCAGYEWHGWCQHGEIHYGSGAQFNYPEDNCCACGKQCSVDSDSLSATFVIDNVSNVSNSSTYTSFLTTSSSTEAWPGHFDNTNCYKGDGAEENIAGPADQCGSHANQVSPDPLDLFNPSYCGVGDIGYCSSLAQESGANCYSIRKETGGCYLRRNCNKAQCQTNTDFETYVGGGALYPDPSQDNKKCGEEGASQRTFTLYGSDASEENCKQSCENDGRCVAMSGQFSGSTWCVGCSQRLWVYAANAKAYSKR